MEIIVCVCVCARVCVRVGGSYACGARGASPGLVDFITPLGGRDPQGGHVRNVLVLRESCVCVCVCVYLWSLYSMCFIAHYRGV